MEIGCEDRFMALGIKDLPAGGACEDDLRVFSRKMVELYVGIPAKALRAIDSNHLNLGMRWAGITSDSMLAGSEYLDVFSINCYGMKPLRDDIEKVLKVCDRPILIGEFQFGTTDRGCFASALRTTLNSKERGVAYQYYVEQGAAMPSLLGCHYFCLEEDGALGRYDGECSIWGFIDVAHRPYEEMFEAATAAHERMYAVKARRIAPLATAPIEVAANET